MSVSRGYQLTRACWRNMHGRCTDTKQESYHRYGGRGISVCERWQKFENFLKDMGEKPSGLSLDRINNDGNYEPGNCRWATAKQQANNKKIIRLELVGKRFGRMTCVEYSHTKNQNTFWRFKCDCGRFSVAAGYLVVRGTTVSCGCMKSSVLRAHFARLASMEHVND